MSPGEPILIICHSFPPVFGIGGRRWAKFAKELARRGHPVHVIRSTGPKDGKPSLWIADVQYPNIIAHPLPQRYPTVLMKQPLTSIREKVIYRVWLQLLPLLTKGNWYDRTIFWRKQLLYKAEELIAEHGIRNVIVTGAPFSLLSHAAELKQRIPGIHLVADFRDPWTWGPYYGQSSMSEKRMADEREKESLVAKAFDKLISPHANIVEHLRMTYGGAADRFVTLPHAIDLDELRRRTSQEPDGVFRMLYAGSLYGAEEAEVYFEQVLRAFEALRVNNPRAFAKSKLDLFITGHGTKAYEEKVNARSLAEQVRFNITLPPKEIFQRIADADLVLTFIPNVNKNLLGTKFNEIFYLRRPVLHIGEPGLVSRTIVERKLGASMRVDELVRELPRIISGERKIEIDLEADHSAVLLGPITDRLINEVLI